MLHSTTKIKKPKKMILFNVEDYILYILNKLEPDKSDKIRLNKIAFFVEFAFIYNKEKWLSNIKYAAIDMGIVIDDYDSILKKMEKDGKIKIDGYIIRPLRSSNIQISEEISNFLDFYIKKYSSLNKSELIGLSHSTDSYKITTENEKIMGRIVDKNLAVLETFFDENEEYKKGQIDENKLPVIDESRLKKYEFK